MKIEYSECQPVVVHGSFDIFLAALMTISLFIVTKWIDFQKKESSQSSHSDVIFVYGVFPQQIFTYVF